MLWQADAALARRDPALPGLATLLDPAALIARVNATLHLTGRSICQGEPYYVRYKAGTNCLVGYQLQTETGSLYLHGVALPFGDVAKAQKRLARATGSKVGPGSLYLDDVALVLSFFPNDRRLNSLAHLADATKAHQLWQRLAPDHPLLGHATLTPLRYKPERRFVARLHSPDGDPGEQDFLLRLYTNETYVTALANQQAFASTEQLRIARVVGRSDRRGALLLEWLPGRPLDEMLQQPGATVDAAVYAAGQALAALHRQSPALPIRYTPAADHEALDGAIAAIHELLPEQRVCAHLLQRKLRPLLAQQVTAPCAIHGDFSADQLLWPAEPSGRQNAEKPRVAILDLDRAGYGSPATDLGSFVAHLHQLEIRAQLTAAQRRAITAHLLAGYSTCAEQMPDDQEIRTQTAVRLLRLAPDAFRQRWSGSWPAYVATVLERVVQIVNTTAP